MSGELYQLIKTVHIATAFVTICVFTYRGSMKLRDSEFTPPLWLKIFPHTNDTVLLICAIYLATSSRQLPISTDWVSAKVVALIVYIGMGMVVMRFARSKTQRIIAFALAILSFSYIVLVALSRSPTIGF